MFTTEDGRVTIHASVRDSIHPPCSSILGPPHMRPRHRAVLERRRLLRARRHQHWHWHAQVDATEGCWTTDTLRRHYALSEYSHTRMGERVCTSETLQRTRTSEYREPYSAAVRPSACRCMTTRRSTSRCAVLAKLCIRHRFKAQWQVRLQRF